MKEERFNTLFLGIIAIFAALLFYAYFSTFSSGVSPKFLEALWSASLFLFILLVVIIISLFLAKFKDIEN
jgi:drug/metabolite transporter (DMT)-like permease